MGIFFAFNLCQFEIKQNKVGVYIDLCKIQCYCLFNLIRGVIEMTAHKHAAMIKAKADNMDLVVFAKSLKWHEVDSEEFQFFNQHDEYFLCLPQHKEACLHWLNGGATQVKYKGDCWQDIFNDPNRTWPGISYFMMRHNVDYRIKPRKEKRWIAVKGITVSGLYDTKRELELMYAITPDVQFIEIEVEI